VNIEFECQLSDGRNVSVVAVVEVESHCDCYCDDTTHPHIIDYNFESVMDTTTEVEAQLDDKDRAILETACDAEAYRELRAAEEESEDEVA
jgi:hypothetical protein